MNRAERRALTGATNRVPTGSVPQGIQSGGRPSMRPAPPTVEGSGSHPSVRLHIDELILHGFALSDRYAIADGLQHELARLLRTNGVPPPIWRHAGAPAVDAGETSIAHGAGPQAIGRNLANAVYGDSTP